MDTRKNSTKGSENQSSLIGAGGRPMPVPNGGDSPAVPVNAAVDSFTNFAALGLPQEPARLGSIFDNLDDLKIDQDDDDDTSEEILTTVPIRRPGKRAFRAHPSDVYQFEAFILEDAENKTVYYVRPEIGRVMKAEDLEIKKVVLALCVNRAGVMFFWPISAEGTFRDGGLKAVKLAREAWYKAVGDLKLGGYRTRKMREDYGPPLWPESMPPVNELLTLAFHGNIINSLDHPAVRAAQDL